MEDQHRNRHWRSGIIPRHACGGHGGIVTAQGHCKRSAVLSTLCLALAILGCSASDSPQGVADRFVQAYYVQIDQAQALEFTTGLARERLHQELQRVASLRQGSSLEQARPQVSYILARTQPEGQQALLVYDLTIAPPQVKPFLKKILIIMEQRGEQWKVINFTETDAQP